MNIEPIHSKDGKVYWVESGDKLYIQRLQSGQYQRSNWVFAQELIDDWTRCLDVGTNNACNAIHYAARFQHVECFEPTPLAQTLWENTVRDNGVANVILHKNGLGECYKQTEIITHENNGGHNHLSHFDKNPRSKPHIGKRKRVPVEVRTVDSYAFQSVGFIKVDVEGYEKFVLEGAVDTINRCRPTIQLEIVANQCRKFNYSAEDMIEWIRGMDYTVVSRNRGNLFGQFKSSGNRLLYQGEYHKGEMDLWFQPNERVRKNMTKVDTFSLLFQEEQ